jgi:hypothetical protein
MVEVKLEVTLEAAEVTDEFETRDADGIVAIEMRI